MAASLTARPCGRDRPALEGRARTASRRARARALNWASTMWCALRPYGTWTCRQIAALKTNDSKMCRVMRRVVVRPDHRRHALGLAVHEVGPAGQVDGDLGERLVQRDARVREPPDARLVAQRLAERLAERDRGVLDRVVAVDVQVAGGLGGQVERAVLPELGQHVVEEPDAGGHVDLAGAVEVDLDEDLGLLGPPLDPPGPRGPSARPFRSLMSPPSSEERPGALCYQCARSSTLLQRGAERRHLLGCADAHPQPFRRADLADQHAVIKHALPDPAPVGEPAEQHEVGVGVGHRQALAAQPGRPGRRARRAASPRRPAARPGGRARCGRPPG